MIPVKASSKPMYVCVCKAVTDREICEAIDAGAQSAQEIAESLGAGTCCGSCVETTEYLIEQRKAAQLSYAAA